MSFDQLAVDPYRSPSLPEGPLGPRARAGKPGALNALCVVCIVLGGLGLFNTLFGTVGAIVGPKMQQAMFMPKSAKGMPPEFDKVQQQFQDEVAVIQTKYFWPTIVALLFRFVVAGSLLAGGLMSLFLREDGRKILLIGLALALAFELVHAILQSVILMEVMTATNSFITGLLASMPNDKKVPAGFNKTMTTFIRVAMTVQFVLMYLLVLAKAGLYIFGLVYVQKPHIKGLFSPMSKVEGPMSVT